MFSFSIKKDDATDVRKTTFVSHGITEDSRHLKEQLRNTGAYRDDELYYRAENADPDSLAEAVEFVQGIFYVAPSRVWIGDEAYEVTDQDVANVEKPGG